MLYRSGNSFVPQLPSKEINFSSKRNRNVFSARVTPFNTNFARTRVIQVFGPSLVDRRRRDVYRHRYTRGLPSENASSRRAI